jgi:hypothetical protein
MEIVYHFGMDGMDCDIILPFLEDEEMLLAWNLERL